MQRLLPLPKWHRVCLEHAGQRLNAARSGKDGVILPFDSWMLQWKYALLRAFCVKALLHKRKLSRWSERSAGRALRQVSFLHNPFVKCLRHHRYCIFQLLMLPCVKLPLKPKRGFWTRNASHDAGQWAALFPFFRRRGLNKSRGNSSALVSHGGWYLCDTAHEKPVCWAAPFTCRAFIMAQPHLSAAVVQGFLEWEMMLLLIA